MKHLLEIHIQEYTGYIKGGFLWFIEDNLGTHAIGCNIHECIHNYETAIAAEGVMP
jgi:hypothetical protein